LQVEERKPDEGRVLSREETAAVAASMGMAVIDPQAIINRGADAIIAEIARVRSRMKAEHREATMPWGMHEGHDVAEIAVLDPGYLVQAAAREMRSKHPIVYAAVLGALGIQSLGGMTGDRR
jgi:hypothetical protein